MVIRILILLLALSSCRSSENHKLELDYDDKSVKISSEVFFIEKIRIFNSVGKSLYELKLQEGGMGQSEVFLFQNLNQYLQEGNLDAVKRDTLEKYIYVVVHSREKKRVKLFEAPFNLNYQGKETVETIKESFP